MDSEEFEQIPWSSLMTDKAQGVDPKVYAAVGVVGLVVAVIFGMRLFGGSETQPVPPPEVNAVATTSAATSTTVGLVISEADLMADPSGSTVSTDALRAVAYAEWFVTDYFTMDGSTETERSLRALLAPSAANMTLPHSANTATAVTYVEWARSVGVTDVGGGEVAVDVIYRTITETEAGFVRDPISEVVVTLRTGTADDGIIGPPVPVPVALPAESPTGENELPDS